MHKHQTTKIHAQTSNYKNTCTNIKLQKYMHKHQTTKIHAQTSNTFFEELVPSVSALLKEQIMLGHAGIVEHCV